MKKSLAIVGGGSAALMLAASLDPEKFEVTVFEKNAALGRKFLVAGDGGFNLTHSEAVELMAPRYIPQDFIKPFICQFSNQDFRQWLVSIGIPTFVGSSQRVFPEQGIKPIQVLNAILKVLKTKGVILKPNHQWLGWNVAGALRFAHKTEEVIVKSDVVVFALGGGSWSKTGTDGTWLPYFAEKGISIQQFEASNCAFKVDWPEAILNSITGKPLKNIQLKVGDISKKGELVITRFGLEGGVVYGFVPKIREALKLNDELAITIDLKPSLTESEIESCLNERGPKSTKRVLKEQLNIGETALLLLKSLLNKEQYVDAALLAKKIKQLPIQVKGLSPLEEAISSVGGIPLTELDNNLQFIKLPKHYAIGEMLNWDAPTGGYLLQACFSMGWGLAQNLNQLPSRID
jgi:uncharacterized flavoprotein (TIGR03862 family)